MEVSGQPARASVYVTSMIALNDTCAASAADTNNYLQPGSGEVQSLLKSFQEPSAVLSRGVTVNGTKYHGIQATNQEIIAKQVRIKLYHPSLP